MKRFLLSGFGLGFLPIAPGTWGSLLPIVVFMVLSYLPITAAVIMAVLIVMTIAASWVCVAFTAAEEARAGKIDPGYIVADEIAGQSVALLPIVFLGHPNICITAAAGFLLFRLFDIFKPWPIRKLESLPGGWGVLLDDLLAGVYAGIILFFLVISGAVDYIGSFCCVDFTSMNPLVAIILGSVQGLTEFLPVSSSGHLVLFENMFGLDPETPQMLLFDLAVHAGTVGAILIVFRKSIVAFVKSLVSCSKYGPSPLKIYKRSPSVHLLVLAMVATFVTGVAGVLCKDYLESARGSLGVVAAMWIVTGTVLLVADRKKKARMSLRQLGIIAAIIIGLAQFVAIIPGISRSGSTICVAILLGLHRKWAVEFSFLIGIPAILGATLVETISNFEHITSAALPISVLIVGPIAAAIVGVFALKMLISVSRRAKLKVFAFYCYGLSIVVFAYLLMH